MPHQLPDLPYAYNALEPAIDAQTMEIHHGRHHATYISNLNAALEGTGFENLSVDELLGQIEQLPAAKQQAIINNGGGHSNHSLFWQVMSPGGGGLPRGELAKAIDEDFGNFERFKEAFKTAALGRFGSGWAWLSLNSNHQLIVENTLNQDSPLMAGNTPLLGLDVWEHAYYLNYQNRRPDYINAFFDVIDWSEVARRYESALD